MTNLSAWISKQDDVAVVLRQKLVSVEGEGAVVYPPTYADAKEGYNIDVLGDGRKVVTIDSEGAQANRMEPMFKRGGPLEGLVPQVDITLKDGQTISLLDAGHRLGDALVRNTAVGAEANAAFTKLLNTGDASDLARIGPTSLVFGVWDSRDTQAKLPRIVRSVVRGWDVDRLTRSAQYNPPVDYSTLDVFSEEDRKKSEGDNKSPLAQLGFVHVPATGAPGGVLVRGEITRDVTVNLIALRRLRGSDDATTDALRRYVLALSLLAAIEEHDGFYRQGCLLVPDGEQSQWQVVSRSGKRSAAALDRAALVSEAKAAKEALGVSADREVSFEKAKAQAEVADKVGAKAAKKAKK